MKNTAAQTAQSSAQGQLNLNVSHLYQHFLAGEIEAFEFSELVDALIGLQALAETAEEPTFCTA